MVPVFEIWLFQSISPDLNLMYREQYQNGFRLRLRFILNYTAFRYPVCTFYLPDGSLESLEPSEALTPYISDMSHPKLVP